MTQQQEQLYSTKYYEVIIDEKYKNYGILNTHTGVVETEVESYPGAISLVKKLTELLEEQIQDGAKESGNVVELLR